jgi:hypothetical protein
VHTTMINLDRSRGAFGTIKINLCGNWRLRKYSSSSIKNKFHAFSQSDKRNSHMSCHVMSYKKLGICDKYWILHVKICITRRINPRTLYHPKGHRPEGVIQVEGWYGMWYRFWHVMFIISYISTMSLIIHVLNYLDIHYISIWIELLPLSNLSFLNFFHMYSNCYIFKFWSNSNIYIHP